MEQTFEDYKEITVEDAKQEVELDLPKKVETVSQPPAKIDKPNQLLAQDNGMLVGSSLEQQYRLAKYYHQSGLLPKTLNSPEKVLVALQICHELGLKPMASISKIAVINGVPHLFGDLPLSLVLKSGLCENFFETWIHDENQNVIGATCTVKRKGLQEISRQFTITDAESAGLYKNDVWNKYERRMLQFRARTWALKDAFPDVLLGMSIVEYDTGEAVNEKGESLEKPQSRLAEKLSE